MTIYYAASTGGFYDDNVHLATKIPGDAIPISNDRHQFLLSAQSMGKVISADDEGNPVESDPPGLSVEELANSIRKKRNLLLAETDYLMMPDYQMQPELLYATKMYRQSLRDITLQSKFPSDVIWPEQPL